MMGENIKVSKRICFYLKGEKNESKYNPSEIVKPSQTIFGLENQQMS
jgi:hypothetical protein